MGSPYRCCFQPVLWAALALLPAGQAAAQAWPSDTVKIVVPYPPGTEPDVLARDLGNRLFKESGKTVVVENRPGANAIIGSDYVAKAAGDGNTLLMVDRLALETNPFLYAKVPYRWQEDFKPVTDLGQVQLYVAVSNAFPAKTYREFIDYARANPQRINVGTGGQGHVNHLGMAMLASAEGVQFTYVPFKGVAPAMTATMAGDVDSVMAGGLAVSEQYKAGKIRVLVAGAAQRAAMMPDVPTLQEAGGKAGSIPSTVFTLFAPGKTPDALVAQINRAVTAVTADPSFRKAYEARGLLVRGSSPEATLAAMKEEAGRYESLIKSADIKPD
ncbi:tripartite tricarboxylate transporter substrate binding protein [Achromobacter insolitus]|uniref:Bug family tripartite tricarboxylate transporter substrate binding protein n=1 Tax=Achromobacter insolitus TaxID=217204 RepID=UPI0011EB8E75|nr:tripartite tricarboxylate transporter substrate-binding protein [Achromobacter insolitus]QEK93255.1 tripartite tricarboxylate transporter substrate binding protein [Achromobacter insolitus]